MDYDVIVIGAGVIGSWTALHLAKNGRNTLLIEKYPLPHTHGSSHGPSRIIRKIYKHGHHAAMMPEAYAFWKNLQKSSGVELLKINGHLSISKKNTEQIPHIRATCEKFGIEHSYMTGSEVNQRFPGLQLDDTFEAIYEPTGGVLDADKCLDAIQKQFIKVGGTLHDNESVQNIEHINDNIVHIHTSKMKHAAKSIVMCCGPWTNKLLKPLEIQLPLEVSKVRVTYWKKRNSGIYTIANFPSLSNYFGVGMYGLPCNAHPDLFKFCYHHHELCDPDEVDSTFRDQENLTNDAEITEFVRKHLPMLEPQLRVMDTCLLTNTPDGDYVMDRHPKYKNIIIGAGMSGHGFKTAPVVGNILCEMVEGVTSSYNTQHFVLDRFSKL